MKKILLLSAYHAQSHDYWARLLINHLPEYRWTLLTLSARYYSWRIKGNAWSFMSQYSEELAQNFDVVIATSMTDVATVKALCPKLSSLPVLLYFHENQFAYPSSKQQKNQVLAQITQIYGALASQQLLFNSEYNRKTFFHGAKSFLQQMPDFVDINLVDQLEHLSTVLQVPVYINFDRKFDTKINLNTDVLTLCWAARWEYDKGPDELLMLLQRLEKSGMQYQIIVMGQSFRKQPEAFDSIEKNFQHRLVHFGFADSRDQYLSLLSQSDIFISTAKHEFFGISVREAHLLGLALLLPNDLVYPELYPNALFYDNIDQAEEILLTYQPAIKEKIGYSNQPLLQAYKQIIETMVEKSSF